MHALICSEGDLEDELAATVLGRGGFEHHTASRLEDAHLMALAARPAIVMIDRDLPRADQLVAALREDRSTRSLSIAVVARGDFDETELALLEAGANAILRLPAGPDWDARLNRLMKGKRLTPDQEQLLTEAAAAIADGKFAGANKMLNKLYASD